MSKILVIDDEDRLRQMIRMALRQRGYDVVEAASGEEGIEMARQVPPPDLVICDVNMSPMNGYQTLKAIRGEPGMGATPVILMTGLADNAGMRQGMELGADDYLPKPFAIDALFATVDVRLKKAQTLRAEAEKTLTDLRDNISLMLPHELRTPLNGILAYGELLQNDAAGMSPAEVSEMGQVIAESGKRLHRLIENFLIYAQIEILQGDHQKMASLRMGRTPHPEQLVKTHACQQAELCGRLADLTLVDVSDQPVAMADNYLSKIVDELVQNAFKFSAAGKPVQVAFRPDGRFAVLTIGDKGRGFEGDHVYKIGAYMQFERKFHEQQGLGLGLTISKRLAEVHGGSLLIESRKGEGATVTVKIPLAPAE
jgi:two-component system, sensor histidine kinase and response regulator